MTTDSAQLDRGPSLDVEPIAATAEQPGRWHQQLIVRWNAFCLFIFWATLAATLVAIAWLSLIPRQQTFDTGGARQVRRIGAHAFEAEFSGRLPQDCLVGCEGFELTKSATADEIVKEQGCCWVDAEHGIVRWSPRPDGALTTAATSSESPDTIPTAVLIVPGTLTLPLGRTLLWFLIPAAVLATSGLAVALGDQSTRSAGAAFTLSIPANLTGRTILVAAVGVGLAFVLIPDWNRVVTCPDSRSYVENQPIRTPLTAWWIATFDSERARPLAQGAPAEHRTIAHWGPSNRYATAVHAWKVLFAVSACVLAWALSSIVPWWMLASLFLAAAAVDGSQGPWSSGMSGYLDAVLSEPLSFSLMLLLLVSLAGYFSRPTWTRGLALGVCLNLLILARPASLAFAAVIGGVWLLHWRRDSFGIACQRAGGIALLLVGGLVLQCGFNWFEHGYFRQHAFTGMNLMTTALQVADTSDADDFADPKISQYARTVTSEAQASRKEEFGASVADANCWQIAVPAYAAIYGATAEAQPFSADDVLTRVARGIIRRHPRAYLQLAASSFWNGFWRTWIHVPLLVTFAAGLWLFWRSGDCRFLFVACLAAMPFVGIIPACVTNYPIDRYRSLTSFAEICSLPLAIGVALSASVDRATKSKRRAIVE